MPSYTFLCPKCGQRFERNLPVDADQSQVVCPNGHRQVQRVYLAPPVMFKGHGYYVTDNHTANKSTV
jgi:putative FmdB family regulatory protein